VITDYEQAREAARKYLVDSKKQTVCLLGGHVAEEVIADCAICQAQGCISCLDEHRCDDHERIM